MIADSPPLSRPHVARSARDMPLPVAAALIVALGVGVFWSMSASRTEAVADIPIRLGPATAPLAVPEALPQPPAPPVPVAAPVVAAPPAPVVARPDVSAERRRAAPALIVNFGNEAGQSANPLLARLLPQGTRLTARREGDGAVLTRPALAADGHVLFPVGTRIEGNGGTWSRIVPPGGEVLALPSGAASLRTIWTGDSGVEMLVARDIMVGPAAQP